MSNQLLPGLVRDYFPNQDGLEVAIVGQESAVLYSSPEGLSTDIFQEHDFSLPLLDPARQMTPRRRPDGRPERGGRPPRGPDPDGGRLWRGERGPRAERSAGADERQDPGGDGWRLLVRHRARLARTAAVVAVRNRNLALSFGVLALLGSSVLLLLHSSRRLVAISDQKMEFVAGVSHELRTPLAVIRSAG